MRSEDQCFFHGYEPIPEAYFKICLECCHCWVTEEEFLADVEKMPVTVVGEVTFCPLCSHDF